MFYIKHQFPLIKATNILLIILLSSCIEREAYKRQAAANSGEFYLDTAPLISLYIPAEVTLPNQNNNYNIPNNNTSGMIGVELDIRPPVQPLIPRVYPQYTKDMVTLLIDSKNNNVSMLWKEIISTLLSRDYTIDECDDSNHILITGWIKWNKKDENCLYRSRYQVSVQPIGDHQQAVIVKLLNLEKIDRSTINALSKKHYSMELLNKISTELYQYFNRNGENLKIKQEILFVRHK